MRGAGPQRLSLKGQANEKNNDGELQVTPTTFMATLSEIHSATPRAAWPKPKDIENQVLALRIRNWCAERGFDVTLHDIAAEFGISWQKANALARHHNFGHLLTGLSSDESAHSFALSGPKTAMMSRAHARALGLVL